MAPPPAALPEELIEAILLRFPADEPAFLFRACLICKPWCRLISSPGFRRRYREFHGAPPVLGFLCRWIAGIEKARFVPTSASGSLLAELRQCCAVDAHHGRVLLRCPGKDSSEHGLVVWDPISDERRRLPIPARWRFASSRDWNAAVLCAAADRPCDHLHCHRRPFVVVFVSSHSRGEVFISTYSSDTGIWSDRIFPQDPLDYISISWLPCAHVGDVLYFASKISNRALKYDLSLHEMSVIGLPPLSTRWQPLALTSTEDGGLGCATVHKFRLYMWSREDGSQVDDGWTQNRVIDLEMLLFNNAILISPCVVGFANGTGVVFLRAGDVIFTIDLKTKNLKKVSKGKFTYNVLPYMRFCTPEFGAAHRGEGAAQLHEMTLRRRTQGQHGWH